MALQVWLPLNGNTNNQGLANITTSASGLTSVSGKLGSGYRFDNGSQSGAGISINSNLLDILGSKNSIAVWVKPYGNHVHYNGTILSSGNWNSSCWAFGVSQDNTQVDLFGNHYNTYINCSVPVNTWTHLACINDGTTAYLYKNGEYVGSSAVSSISKSDATNTYVGRETYASGYFGFNGAIQDLRVYNHCLSPKEVKEISKGLVLHYKMDDGHVEPTTNLAPYPTPSGAVGAVGWDQSKHPNAINVNGWSYGYNSGVGNPSKGYHACWNVIDGIPTIVYRNLNSEIGAQSRWLGISSNAISITSGTKYTISFEAKSTSGSGQIGTGIYYNNGSSNNFHDGCPYLTIGREWKHYSYTFTAGKSFTGNIYLYGHNGTEGINYVRNIQLELKDHATPYTPTSRSETTVYDCSGFGYNGSVNGTLVTSSDTSRYSVSTIFNGNDSSILLGNLSTIVPEGVFTFNCWFKKTDWGSKSYETIFGGPSGFELECKNSSTNSPVIMAYSWGQGTKAYSLNEWNMLTMVRTASDAKFYLNGELVITGTAGTIPSGDYFIGAWKTATQQNYKGSVSDVRIYATPLSAEDVKELYNTSAIICDNGTVMAYSLEE